VNPRLRKDVFQQYLSREAIYIKIRVQADDRKYLLFLRDHHQDCVHKIHGNVLVFFHPANDPGNIILADLLQKDPPAEDPFKKIDLRLDIKIQHIGGDFRKHCGGSYKPEVLSH
jgi:hypothetical protein